MRRNFLWLLSGIFFVFIILWLSSPLPEAGLLKAGEIEGKAASTTTTAVKLPTEDIWTEITASPAVQRGGNYQCNISLWNRDVNPIDSVTIIFLAPNSKNIALGLGDRLYTRLAEDPSISGPDVEMLPPVVDQEGKLDSLIWFVPQLPVAFQSEDTVKINFKLTVDEDIDNSVKLNNDFLIFITKNKEQTLILSDTKITEIMIPYSIMITKSIPSEKYDYTLGEEIYFQIEAKNNGGKDADSVLIVDTLPPEIEFVSFAENDDSDTSYIDNDSLKWEIYYFPQGSLKRVGFTAKVKEDLQFAEDELTRTTKNSAKYVWGKVISPPSEVEFAIHSDPDLVPKITAVEVPHEWNYGDSIIIRSEVENLGGAPVNTDFSAKLSYFDLERAPLTENIIWEGVVEASFEIPILTQRARALPDNKITFDKGGIYKFCLTVDLNNEIKERKEDNNEVCVSKEIRIPSKLYLSDNILKPDVSGEELTIMVQVSIDSRIQIKIYNVAGELIKELYDGFCTEGFYNSLTSWNGRDSNGNIVSSGVYVFAIKANNFHETRKVIVVR